MARIQYSFCIGLCALALATGCTHEQLRRDSVNEAMTVGDLQTQQVLNNLAMFVYDYNSMPYFAYPNQGAAIITDQINGGVSASGGRPIVSGGTASKKTSPLHFSDFMLTALGLTANAQRSSQESFVMTPINDPRKLELMRCAYQLAVGNCGYGPPGGQRQCPDCNARFNTFYTGDPDGKIEQNRGGTITSECLKGPCWFHVGCEKEVPKCPCIEVGHYCGVYVWVMADGRDELSKLTLAILDYAIHDAPSRITKTVTYYVDALGLPTNKEHAVGTVVATVAVNEDPASVINLTKPELVQLEQTLQDRVRRLSALLDKAKPGDTEQRKILNDEIDDANQKLYFLDHQLNNPGLKQEFWPSGIAPAPAFSIIPGLQQSQNALTAPPVQ